MGRVLHRLPHGNEVIERHVHGAHCQCLGLRINVGYLVNQALIDSALAEDRRQPSWSRLLARDQSLGAQYAGCWVYVAGQSVDGQDVRRLDVPWAVLYPV